MRVLVPVWATVDPVAVVIAVGAFVALFHFHAGMIRTLLAAAAPGMAWTLLAA